VAVSDLAEARVRKGMSQRHLAEMTGLSLSTLARLEKYRVRLPPLQWYVNCAIALGVELDEVVDSWHFRWQMLAPGAQAPMGRELASALNRRR
jgi:transcriptional regulator with XRE-family HTH domain